MEADREMAFYMVRYQMLYELGRAAGGIPQVGDVWHKAMPDIPITSLCGQVTQMVSMGLIETVSKSDISFLWNTYQLTDFGWKKLEEETHWLIALAAAANLSVKLHKDAARKVKA